MSDVPANSASPDHASAAPDFALVEHGGRELGANETSPDIHDRVWHADHETRRGGDGQRRRPRSRRTPEDPSTGAKGERRAHEWSGERGQAQRGRR